MFFWIGLKSITFHMTRRNENENKTQNSHSQSRKQTNTKSKCFIKIKSGSLNLKFHKFFIKRKWPRVCALDSRKLIPLMVRNPNFSFQNLDCLADINFCYYLRQSLYLYKIRKNSRRI